MNIVRILKFIKQNQEQKQLQKLITAYVQSIEMTGVGKAIAESGKSLAGNLERILTQKDK